MRFCSVSVAGPLFLLRHGLFGMYQRSRNGPMRKRILLGHRQRVRPQIVIAVPIAHLAICDEASADNTHNAGITRHTVRIFFAFAKSSRPHAIITKIPISGI